MFKQGLIYLILSILLVVFTNYFHQALTYIEILYTWCNAQLIPIFSHSPLGIAIRQVLVLVFLPIAFASLPAICYQLIKKKPMPYFYYLVWIFWLIIVLSVFLIR